MLALSSQQCFTFHQRAHLANAKVACSRLLSWQLDHQWTVGPSLNEKVSFLICGEHPLEQATDSQHIDYIIIAN